MDSMMEENEMPNKKAKLLAVSESSDCFMRSFKNLKRRVPPPDFSNVLDFEAVSKFTQVQPFACIQPPDPPETPGLIPFRDWKAFTLVNHPGFFFILNPFTADGQRKWIKRCLRDLSCHPNVTNLDAQHSNIIKEQNIWHLSLDSAATIDDKQLMRKLRWATLGYHHNWDTKKYTVDSCTQFPDDLAQLSHWIAHMVGYPAFKAEAAILNFYHMNSTLSAHTDHSEFDHISPLISVSFGQSAIFMLGGDSKDIEPDALYLRSGDICVMSADCRLAYHAVPKILPATHKPYMESCDEDFKPFAEYLDSSRINMNVRQVLAAGQSFPSEK